MDRFEEGFNFTWKKWAVCKKLITILAATKIVAAFLAAVVPFAFPYLLGVSAFWIPFWGMSVLADGTGFGLLILIFLGIDLLACIVSPFLVRSSNDRVSKAGMIAVLMLNVVDIMIGIPYYAEIQHASIIINIVFSTCVILLAGLTLWIDRCFLNFSEKAKTIDLK